MISGTFLKSKISQRIALLLLIAAAVPTLFMTLLSSQKITDLVNVYEHKALLEQSRSYGLTAFSNLTFARSKLEDIKKLTLSSTPDVAETISLNLASGEIPIFSSVIEVAADSSITNIYGNHYLSNAGLQKVMKVRSDKTQLIVLPTLSKKHSVNLVYKKTNRRKPASFVVAEISPQFLWGDLEGYPLDLKICAYQVNNSSKKTIFCSNDEELALGSPTLTPINHAEWELFLKGEFNAKPWLFTINRLEPITKNHLKEYVGSTAYISISLLSILVIGLLSLIQIRRAMVPLENLIKGTKKIAEGDFTPIPINDSLEFSELAESFNNMSSDIKNQLDAQRSFSMIDREIGTSIDTEQVSELVLQRMKQLDADAVFCIMQFQEQTATELQCICSIGGNSAISNMRVTIGNKEIAAIKRYDNGQFKTASLTSDFTHERLMAELNTNHIWVLPIFWQGELCALLSVGSKDALDTNNKNWHEYRELAKRIAIVISAQAREQNLLIEAQYDKLTGLPNRTLLKDRLTKAMAHADYIGKPMWIVFIDLDRFKVINDSLGHSVGDALLTEIGSRLQSEVRESDTVARFGGDEFVVVLSSDTGEGMKLNILNRLMQSISSPIHINNHELMNTCSIGVSTYPEDGEKAETLIKNADIAMYRAKEIGRNNYQFFTQDLNDQASERMNIISLLHKAIENNELCLHYQPKVDLLTKSILGLEALIRWNSPELGHVSPAKFIPIAEEAGLINNIGEWTLKTACAQLAVWHKSGIADLVMSVNISAKQFQQDHLIDNIKSILLETAVQGEQLELEITESLLMEQSGQILDTLHKIKTLGVALSIDDFGTGYSSLSYLNTLPIDTLKIDKSFVDTISITTKESPIVNTVIQLANNLNLKVIAEGVETAEQIAYLKSHGCDQIQGYYFSKPLPAEEMRALLLSGKKLKSPSLKLVKTPNKKISNKQQ